MKLTRDRLKQIIKEELQDIMTQEAQINYTGGQTDTAKSPEERIMYKIRDAGMQLSAALESMPTDHERDAAFQYLNAEASKLQQGQPSIFKTNQNLWNQWRKIRIDGGHPDPAKGMSAVQERKKR